MKIYTSEAGKVAGVLAMVITFAIAVLLCPADSLVEDLAYSAALLVIVVFVVLFIHSTPRQSRTSSSSE